MDENFFIENLTSNTKFTKQFNVTKAISGVELVGYAFSGVFDNNRFCKLICKDLQ
jgi:hypothetical protein